MPSGRFAPSPTGDLHLGNLRTALIAWLFARSDDSTFGLRFEDLDTMTVRPEYYLGQADDLRALGLDWDEPVINQSDRLDIYRAAIDRLLADGLAYPCYCSRREIREATQAPNGPWSQGSYPQTCRHLTAAQRSERERAGRPPAYRLRTDSPVIEFDDLVAGPSSGVVDDLVIQRNDGTPAYNLVVVIDDVAAEIEVVVRADDLLSSTPRQIQVARTLGLTPPRFAHVPLVLAPNGDRLAKRDGAVTLHDRMALGETPGDVLSYLASTLGLCEPDERVAAADLIDRFDPTALPREPLTLEANQLHAADPD